MTYAIDKHVPLPGDHSSEFPFAEMQPGDSFLIPCEMNKFAHWRNKLQRAAKQMQIRFASKRDLNGKGLRVWFIGNRT